jgi:hypothetical protein
MALLGIDVLGACSTDDVPCNGAWFDHAMLDGWLVFTASVSYSTSIRGLLLTHCLFNTHQTTVGLVAWS